VKKLLSPDVNLRLIAPKRRNTGNPWFKRRTLSRTLIETLPQAAEPMTTRQITVLYWSESSQLTVQSRRPSKEALRLRISGFIVSVFTKRVRAVRYVVEADHSAFSGMLHIFNGDQLEHR
jgi:hypothetical protein